MGRSSSAVRGQADQPRLARRASGRCYFDVGVVRFLVLDTVNPAGGWQGSIDAEQFQWLEEELVARSRSFLGADGRGVVHGVADRLFVLVSHHPLETLINDYGLESPRHLEAEVSPLLARFEANGPQHDGAR